MLGEYSTHSFGECPRDGAESYLSQILEDAPPRKYYLSAKAFLGILNRAAKRGKDLPEALKTALLMQSESGGGGNKSAVLRLNDQGGSVTVFDPAQITSPVNRSRPAPGKPCHTLTSRMGTGGGNVPIMFRQQRFGSYNWDDVAGTCKARDGKDGTANLVCAVDCRNGTENPETNGTLQAKSAGGQSLNLNNVVREAMTVRRLTPLECERLQGFPDGWTDIGEWVDSKGKTRKTTDSARYKALGNSIALPPWKWVLKRICAQYERDATMASLFDGIGGFPLIWEKLNGKGSCLWASEIEEFPMAVTKKRFG